MLKLGLETESCHLSFQNNRMDIFGFIDFAVELGFDGVMINIIEKKHLLEGLGALGKNDKAHLEKVAAKIKEHGLYVEIDTRGTSVEHISMVIEVAEILGADLIRTFVMSGTGYGHGELVGTFNKEAFVATYEAVLKLVPLLEKHRIKLAFENHELETTEEMLWLINKVNSPWVGYHLDIFNPMPAWEDPLEAAKKCAPQVFTTHIRDAIVCELDGAKEDDKYRMTGVPVGEGNIDVAGVCTYLLDNSSLTRLNIEQAYPYTTFFRRPCGTGGVTEIGSGAFAIKDAPFPQDEVPLEDYYLYDGEHLEKMIKAQLDGCRKSAIYMQNFRENYMKSKTSK